jgi:hypothetical protein
LALGRDKRKEFNEATLKIRERLTAQLNGLTGLSIPEGVTQTDISKVVAIIGEKEANKLTTVSNRYLATLERCSMRRNSYGNRYAMSPGCMKEIKNDAEALYKVVQPK